MERSVNNYVTNTTMEESREEQLTTRSESRAPENIFIDRPLTSDTDIAHVNGHYLPDEDEEEEEDDLVLGDEDDLDDEDFNEDEIEVEVDEDLDEDDLDEDDLVLDADDDEDEEDQV